MWRRDHLLDTIMRDRIVVTLKDGVTFRGLYDGSDKNHHTLLDAESLNPDGSATKADGRVFIPRDFVAFIQKP